MFRIISLFLLGLFSTCSALAQSVACEESYFFKTFKLETVGFYGSHSTLDPAGNAYLFNHNFLTKVDRKGNFIWTKKLVSPVQTQFDYILTTIDGNLLLVGESYDASGFQSHFLLKTDTDGNILWRKEFLIDPYVGMPMFAFKQDTDGSFYAVSRINERGLGFQDAIMLTKFNSSGDIQYNNIYRNQGARTMEPHDLAIIGDHLFIGGHFVDENYMPGLLLKINKTTGALIWTKGYSPNGYRADFTNMYAYDDNQLCIFGGHDVNMSDTAMVTLIDTDGNVKSLRYFLFPTQDWINRIIGIQDGKLICARGRSSASINVSLLKIDPRTGVDTAWEYPNVQIGYTFDIMQENSGALWFLGASLSWDLILGRVKALGEGSCPPQAFSVISAPETFTLSTLDFFATPYDTKIITKNEPFEDQPNPNPTVLCEQVSTCSSVDITGKRIVCALKDTMKLNIVKNPGCLATPVFEYDPASVRLIEYKEGVLRLLCLKEGLSTLKVRLTETCAQIEESVTIGADLSTLAPNLGQDTTICAEDSLVLRPGAGFIDYQWSTGASSDTLVAYPTGKYTVSVTNACEEMLQDEIVINAKPTLPMNLAPELAKCNMTPAQLALPAGFTAFTWSPQTDVLLQGNNLLFNPADTTAYTLKAKGSNGCLSQAALNIKVVQTALLDLGNDLRFCNGLQRTITAGSGFSTYQWNTGAATSAIDVSSSGNYWVAATSAEGCVIRDTVVVTVIPDPLVQLDKTPYLCGDESRVLDAGDYAGYQWSTGENSRQIIVSATGSYAVAVTDANGCIGKDTTIISAIKSNPANFLPADTTICKFGKLEIRPDGNYSTYRWSTGSTTPAILVNSPADYSLTVTDAFGCIGFDTISVAPVDCLVGVYVPNAFTPNNDGKNDYFKPIVNGDIVAYEFTVYNRFGQIIFTTKVPGQGWDGSIHGVPQDSNTFIWTCIYQFRDQSVKQEKGNFLLLR
jgi:gliding motility-associated-like protein